MSVARHAAALAVAALLAGLALLLGSAPQSASAADCENANATINEATEKQLRKALFCLINEKRHQRDRKRLDQNDKLQEAARRHTQTMLEDDCWKHKCEGEPPLGKRIRKTGYLDGAREWHFAENFGCAFTPEGMLDAWLDAGLPAPQPPQPRLRGHGRDRVKDQVSNPPSGCDADAGDLHGRPRLAQGLARPSSGVHAALVRADEPGDMGRFRSDIRALVVALLPARPPRCCCSRASPLRPAPTPASATATCAPRTSARSTPARRSSA